MEHRLVEYSPQGGTPIPPERIGHDECHPWDPLAGQPMTRILSVIVLVARQGPMPVNQHFRLDFVRNGECKIWNGDT